MYCKHIVRYNVSEYCTWENFGGEKISEIWQIMSYFPKFSLPIFTYTVKMYLAYALTLASSPKFSLPIAFTCMVRQNFPPPKLSSVRHHMAPNVCGQKFLWFVIIS